MANAPLAGGIVAALLSLSHPVLAQDTAAPPRLEDLIPDSAIENPEEWASNTEGADVEDEAAEPLGSDSPMAEIPELTVDWPNDLALPPIEQLEPEADIRFADQNLPPLVITPEADLVRINDELTLAFPMANNAFPLREEFIDRFKILSNIEGLSGGDNNIAQLAARARADEEVLSEMLRVYGYYNAQVIRTIGEPPENGSADDNQGSVRFDIIPGQRYQFANIDLGQLNTAPDFESLRAAFGIQTGDPVSSDKIVSEQIDLDVALGESGYPFAKIGEPELEVDHQASDADLKLPVDPAGKYVFAGVTSSLPDFLSGRHLGSIARFESGDVYQRSLEQDLRRAITATGLVSSVTITPREVESPDGAEPGKVELDVDLIKAKLRTIAGAIGYGSEAGFRLQASWEHRNLFPPEGSLKIRGILGTQEQLAGVTFRKNNFGGRDKVLTLDTYASTIDSDAFDARTVAFVANYEMTSTLLFQKPLSWGGGLEIIATDERETKLTGVLSPREKYFVAAVPLNILFDTSDSLLDPTRGFRIGARVSPEISRNDGQNSTYIRSQFDLATYQSVGSKVTFAGRARVGVIAGADVLDIAPSRRLYAGGGGSVRGYGYQAIGPSNALGDPNGGRSLLEVAAEARIRTGFMDGAVSVVPFVDAGTVSRSTMPDFEEIKVGVGLGVRYDTGFGPIRVDVGVPLNPGPNDNPVAVYVSLGQAF
ncbi:autotransporter assembly complex family protein [Pontixanthobacter gangjinensis]|uniref:BamA/TamA family outer membrane protein n=1 Tax=Pontixanthobacter gangjinensis TaxID=1028742 RepID=A0A6I4SNJ3_9SPHN|nr:BamA/TamA family outer membrane protein [Pontixanthobacter gangjinensis]MXO56407.1 BamA/TamA family outer membrane protein [Pontixanthobacter gangjinensis]